MSYRSKDEIRYCAESEYWSTLTHDLAVHDDCNCDHPPESQNCDRQKEFDERSNLRPEGQTDSVGDFGGTTFGIHCWCTLQRVSKQV